MSEQERIQKSSTERTPDQASDTAASGSNTADLANELDSLLDEIDAVLEENAEEFVRNYVQKGGE